jgi:hypothetical protein
MIQLEQQHQSLPAEITQEITHALSNLWPDGSSASAQWMRHWIHETNSEIAAGRLFTVANTERRRFMEASGIPVGEIERSWREDVLIPFVDRREKMKLVQDTLKSPPFPGLIGDDWDDAPFCYVFGKLIVKRWIQDATEAVTGELEKDFGKRFTLRKLDYDQTQKLLAHKSDGLDLFAVTPERCVLSIDDKDIALRGDWCAIAKGTEGFPDVAMTFSFLTDNQVVVTEFYVLDSRENPPVDQRPVLLALKSIMQDQGVQTIYADDRSKPDGQKYTVLTMPQPKPTELAS